MTAFSIGARCRRCTATFTLRDLLFERSGRCPSCGNLLAPDWTATLFEEAARAEEGQEILVKALRRLVGLPGLLEILPGALVRNLVEEVGWEAELSSDPEILEQELRLMRQELAAWDRLRAENDRRVQAGRLHQLAARLRRLAASPTPFRQPAALDPEPPTDGAASGRAGDGGELGDAADALDRRAGQLLSDSESVDGVLASIDSAAALVHERRADR